MARIRTIKPEFWVDDVMVELPFETRLLFIGLWNFADDEGFIEDKPKRLKMQIFPADDVLIEDSLSALVQSGRLHAFDSDQGPILQVANWGRHQRINRATETRFTGIMPRERGGSVSSHAPVTEHSRGKGKEGKGKEGKGSTPLTPQGGKRGTRIEENWRPSDGTVEKIRAEFPGLNLESETVRFVDYWLAVPGQRGVKLDWDATWRNWMRRKGDEMPRNPDSWMDRSGDLPAWKQQ